MSEIERPTVLVVEDNPVERQLVSKILRNANFEVIAVDCGKVVLDTVLNYAPDMILLDALLPDIDGFDVCVELRAHPKGLYIPIIMLTGLDDVVSINRAYEVGATDFFTKPINHTMLIHRIRYLLRARVIMDQLRMSQQSLASAQTIAKLGHWEMDLDKRIFTASEQLCSLYEIEAGENLTPEFMLERCHPDDRTWVQHEMQSTIDSGGQVKLEHRIVLPSGTTRYLEAHMLVIDDEANDRRHLLGLSMDITERKIAEKKILRLAYFDELTGLPSRSLLDIFLDQAIPKAHVHGHCVAILSLDLDLFNRINNSMGHAAGDAVLVQLADRLRKLLICIDADTTLEKLSSNSANINAKDHDVLVRLAADTFIIMLPQAIRDSNQVHRFAERVRAGFQRPFIYRGQELFVTASMGITYSDSGSTQAETMLQQADLALHEAKVEGRNQIREYGGDLVAKVSTHLAMQSDLRKALENGEFELYYQPKVAISDGQVRGFEALVRWQHPVKGLVPPDQFISIAEETGQIVELGSWVLETACRQAQQWREQGLIDVKMAVNVAARQFREASIVENVCAVLEKTGLEPKHLELEMTEGVLMADPHTAERVAQLREKGVSIALDDFGTGFSSLSYITRFPIDTIKIDRCFVRGITAESEKGAIVSAVVSLAHSLGFNVIAEGVEFDSELAVIGNLGCDEVQGYFYSKPQPALGIEQWLQTRQLRCDTA